MQGHKRKKTINAVDTKAHYHGRAAQQRQRLRDHLRVDRKMDDCNWEQKVFYHLPKITDLWKHQYGRVQKISPIYIRI